MDAWEVLTFHRTGLMHLLNLDHAIKRSGDWLHGCGCQPNCCSYCGCGAAMRDIHRVGKWETKRN